MNLINTIIGTGVVPDSIIRTGIRKRLADTLTKEVPVTEEAQLEAVKKHAQELRTLPIAINTDEANQQHYELPASFFQKCLGPRLKYSSAWFETGNESLGEAEEAMLKLTCERAELVDGQNILELGCGWGSLSLWMAEHYPNSSITSVSNSASQKEFIDARAKDKGLTNLTIRTANMIHYEGEGSDNFDRVVSVEMFEHMKNYQLLLKRVSTWLKPGGKLFVHIFTHTKAAYHYEAEDDSDWMALYFFTGGQMPSHNLLLEFQDHLKNINHWQVSGTHYQHTSEHWLKNMDANKETIMATFRETYGKNDARLWWNYWRIFYMACAELWGYENGSEWIVSHYLFEK